MEIKEKKEVVKKTEYILKANLGSNKDGSPKKAKGSKVKLTDQQATNYKQKNII